MLQRSFQHKARRAGEWALQFTQTHQDRPRRIIERCSALLRALESTCAYGSDSRLTIELTLALDERMQRAGFWRQWEPYIDQALRLAQAADDRRAGFRLLTALGDVRALQFSHQSALTPLREAMELADLRWDDWELPFTRYAECLLALGQPDKAANVLQGALENAQQSEHLRLQVNLLSQLGRIYGPRGEWQQAIESFQAALALAREHDFPAYKLNALNFIGSAYIELDQPDQALPYFDEAWSIVKFLGERSGKGVLLNNLGRTHFVKGNYKTAQALLENALEIHRSMNHLAKTVIALVNLARVHIVCDEIEAAAGYLTEARELAKSGENVILQARVFELEGEFYQRQGDFDAAVDAFARSQELYLAGGDIYRAEQIKENLLHILA